MANTGNFDKNRSDLLGKAGYAVCIGVGGTILVVFFLATFIHIFTVLKFIPWLIAFNAAVTGYSLIDKTQESLKHKYIAAVSAGILNVLISYIALVLIYLFLAGGYVFNKWDLLLYLIIGIVCSKVGAFLAAKYQNIEIQRN